jgi:hypothetical protein
LKLCLSIIVPRTRDIMRHRQAHVSYWYFYAYINTLYFYTCLYLEELYYLLYTCLLNPFLLNFFMVSRLFLYF